MNKTLLHKFNECCQLRTIERSLIINDEGIILGITVLAKFSAGKLHMDEQEFYLYYHLY